MSSAIMSGPARSLLVVIVALALALDAGTASAAVPAWTTYRHDAARSGIDPDSTSAVTPSQAWQTAALDGEVYAQPLVYGSYVYVATENNTIYALNAATGGVAWSTHLATPESSSMAPCGDISPSIGITSTPVIDPSTNRIYAVGAVSDGVHAASVHHELFALDVSSGKEIAGFPVAVDPSYPAGGAAVNQLQRAGLALDNGRLLIGYGGNDGDCATYWGWLVSVPTGGGAQSSFEADPSYHEGAIWASGNAPTIDPAGDVFIATGNGTSGDPSNPDYGDAVVKLNGSAQALDWWAPTNWRSLDSSDADLGSSMPTLLPGGYVFQSGKDGNGYVLSGASLGHVGAPAAEVSCGGGGSFGGSVYDPANSTVYATCGNIKAFSLTVGSPPSLTPTAGFSAPSGATGPPTVAGRLAWATNYSSGTLYGLDLDSGAVSARFAIPEAGSEVNHFASPSAGGGRLFVGSGDQVTAYTIAQVQPPTPTTAPVLSRLHVSPHRVSIGLHRRRFRARITYTLSTAAKVTLTVKRQAGDRNGRRRWVRLHGSVTLAGKEGANRFKFPGRIGSHRLGRGIYRLTAAASAGGTTGAARTTTFVVVR